MSKPRKWPPSRWALIQIVLFLCFAGACSYYTYNADEVMKQTILHASETHQDFPVVVFTPSPGGPGYQPHAVRYGALEAFEEAHPDYNLLVLPGQEASLSAQLLAPEPNRMPATDARSESAESLRATFKVEQLGGGRQSLEVSMLPQAPGDPDADEWVNTGWYEATEKSILPQYNLNYPRARYGAGMMISFGMLWLFAYMVLLVGRFFYVRFFASKVA